MKRNMKIDKKEVRVGNYKVLLYSLDDVPVIDVMNLEGTWMVRIPVHFQMYGMLNRLLLELEDDDARIRSNAEEWLKMFFMNWQNVTGIPNGHYHQGVMMLTACYADPSLLKSSFWGKGKDFHKSVKNLRLSFLEWAKERERLNAEAEKSVDIEKEALADQSKQILDGNDTINEKD